MPPVRAACRSDRELAHGSFTRRLRPFLARSGTRPAIRKATEAAKRGLIRVPLRDGRTLHHDVKGRFGAGKVTLRAAPAGTGIIAGGPMRAVFETLGIKDIVAKSVGTSNPHNMIKATFEALLQLNSPRMVATRRGKKVGDLLGRRDETTAEAAA